MRRTTVRLAPARVLALLALLALVVAMALVAVACARNASDPHATGAEAEARVWDEASCPNYYEVVGPARLDELPARGEVAYSPLDPLGRSGRVVACVDLALMQEGSARERADMRNVAPSGWGENREVDIELPTGDCYHGYFWNRSHLLAKSLGGSDDLCNLVCGTRMQNVGANREGAEGGMAYPESLARDWLRSNPNGFVYYTATPEYAGSDLVCRDVVVDLRSSDGLLDCEVVVYNAAKGYCINYATGTFGRE